MIYTVTFNPSLDYIVSMKSFDMGMTNRTTQEQMLPGGKGINVSTVLTNLGHENTALGFVAGFTGDAIEKGLENEKITKDFIHLPEGISRINVKIKHGDETEINGQGPRIDDASVEKLMEKIRQIQDGDTLIISGSVPNTMPNDIYERFLEVLKDKDVRIVVDATGQLLVNSLKYRPFLIKPNRQELSELFEDEVKTAAQTEKYARKLQEIGAQNVLVSLGKDGAMLVDADGGVHTLGTISRNVVNTVGSGDSMVAGFVAGYETTKDYAYALQLGSACGNATAFLSGLATRALIDELMEVYNEEKQ